MNIVCAGFGGQGVLTAGLILGELACDMDKNVTWLPTYGSEMRGGTAACMIKISDARIASPFIESIDLLLAMNRQSLETYVPMVRDGGTVIANLSLCAGFEYPAGLRVYEADATAIAESEHNVRGANLVMLGALGGSGVLFSAAEILQGVNAFFDKKGKNSPKNAACVARGVAAAAGE